MPAKQSIACIVCGATFELLGTCQVYCSVECRKENWIRKVSGDPYTKRPEAKPKYQQKPEQPPRTCPVCSTQFRVDPSKRGKKARFCDNCTRGRKYQRLPNREIACLHCGKKFSTNLRRQKHCSIPCLRAHEKVHPPNYRHMQVIACVCGTCGKSFRGRVTRKYCSISCQPLVGNCLRCIGPHLPRGYNYRRTEDRKRTNRFYASRKWRSLRDKYLKERPHCEECHKAGQKTKATEVHHIQPWRDFPELALEWCNLQALCDPCHNAKHKKRGHAFTMMNRARRSRIEGKKAAAI